jgi:23S rRNA (cytosine1962-C5)-methyltransferase
MKTPNWSPDQFEIIATGNGEKLESWGGVLLLRPDPQAIWNAPSDLAKYPNLNAKYERSSSGGGQWKIFRKFPNEWVINYKNLKFIISPMGFKHTGLFPEQATNWDTTVELIKNAKREINVLNLFGYTGGATVAAASAGAAVTHVDASRGMVEVCKRNVAQNNIPTDRVRYIVDDCLKFVQREERRGKKYDAIIMDPPSFGRGANGEVWKIEEHLQTLVASCMEILSDKPLFFLINSYTATLQPSVMKNILIKNLASTPHIDCYEIGLPTRENFNLPAGSSAIAVWK